MRTKQTLSVRLIATVLTLVMVLGIAPAASFAAPAEEVRHGTVDVTMLHEMKDQPSMCDVMFAAAAEVELRGVTAVVKLKAAYPLPAFPNDGADGTIQNFTVTFGNETYTAESDITTRPLMTVKMTSPLFGLVKGEQIPAQVLTLTLPADALYEKTLKASAFVNVVMNTDVAFRLQLSNLTWEEAPADFEFGTARTRLAPGRYDLPVALKHADKHDQNSMAAAAVLGGKLEVQDSGDAFVNVKLGPVNVYGLKGWSENWKIYSGYEYGDPLNPDDPIAAQAKPAEIVSRDADGNATEIRFRLPFTDKDGVYVTMYVPVVTAYPNAFLSLDFANAVPEGETVVEAPVIDPETAGFIQGEALTVTITAPAGEIYYTTDGSVPTAGNGTRYTAPFSVTEACTVSAVAVLDGRSSAVATAEYTVLTPIVKNGTASVAFGYEVAAEVSVLRDKILNVKLSHNAKADHASYADRAMAMADAFQGLSASDRQAIQAVDAVSGATLTSDACKTAVLEALELNKTPDFTFGSAGKELQPGVYNVPMALRQAGKHTAPSNAAGAFPAVGRLTVDEEGNATLETPFLPVTIGPITDMAYDVLIYQEDDFSTSTPVLPASVLETTVKPEPMPGAGREVPTRISFRIPQNDWDGVYLRFTVDAMGPGYPDAWLELDYAQAQVPGDAQVVTGSAKVDQFGKYTIYTDITVRNGVIDGVSVHADDFISETHRPENEIRVERVKNALKNTWNGMAPTQENAEMIYKAILDKQDPDEVIDSVSGATYSARAVRDAVMSAFDLQYQEEVITVPDAVIPGVYEVEISYYSDIVWHSLVENVKTTAILTVNADGTMHLSFDTFSGTEKEPLYILAFNGVYPDNDRTAELTMEGCTYELGLSSNDYEDEFFAKGTRVVNHVQFPLLGGLDKIYTTNCRMYVPAMNNLNGELSGVTFENGTFNADIFAKIFWDSMKRIGDVPVDFDDVPADFWARDDIAFAVNRGLFRGTSATTFAPQGAMTRAMFVTVLGRRANVSGAAQKSGFADVAADAYYAPYVQWAVENGIVTGVSAAAFEPNRAITRQEMAVMLHRFAMFQGLDGTASPELLQGFKDASSVSGYAAEAMAWAVENCLLRGTDEGLLLPRTTAARAQAAAMLHRLFK